jgi:hypothetical protein
MSLIVNNEEYLIRALADTGASSGSSIFEDIPQQYSHSLKQMTIIQRPGVKWLVNLPQLKLGYVCDIFTP